MEQSFPVKILLWIGKPAESPTPHTKSEEEKDGEQAATIITQRKKRGRGKHVSSSQNITLAKENPNIRASQSHEGLLKCSSGDPHPGVLIQ